MAGNSDPPGVPFCPQCGGPVTATHHFCAGCGYSLLAGPRQAENLYHSPGGPSMGIAVLALLLNIFIWPGLGSLVGGRQIGWAQGFLTLLGLALILTIVGLVIGIPLMIGMWIWGIVTGVQLISNANRR